MLPSPVTSSVRPRGRVPAADWSRRANSQPRAAGVADAAVVSLRQPLDFLDGESRVWDSEGCGAGFAEEDVARLQERREAGPEVGLRDFCGGVVVFFGAGRESRDGC
jgi:hypothetical protein